MQNCFLRGNVRVLCFVFVFFFPNTGIKMIVSRVNSSHSIHVFFFLKPGSHCTALASLLTYYVDQAGLQVTEIHLPAYFCYLSTGIKDVCNDT